jgi:hypothetical protein
MKLGERDLARQEPDHPDQDTRAAGALIAFVFAWFLTLFAVNIDRIDIRGAAPRIGSTWTVAARFSGSPIVLEYAAVELESRPIRAPTPNIAIASIFSM